jgi:hypothetical protein
MSASTGRAMLADATKQVMLAWARAREQWDDEAARRFENTYLEPIAPKIRATQGAMEKLAEATAAARRACSD